MKKTLVTVFAAIMAAAIFFGCSNSSDDNSALLLAAAGGNGGSGGSPDRSGLPENVGTNNFAGKTFSATSDVYSMKYSFGSDTVTIKTKLGNQKSTVTCAYSFNETTKQLCIKQKGLLVLYAYELSGSTLKLANDSRYPSQTKLNEIYNKYLVYLMPIVNDLGSTVYNVQNMTEELPNIENAAHDAGWRVSSVTENAINTSATAAGTDTAGSMDWTFTPATGSFAYTTNMTTTSATFTIENLGKIVIQYASADNIPDLTYATPYTQE